MSHWITFERTDPVQLRFAAYLISAIHKRKITLFRRHQAQSVFETPMVTEEKLYQDNPGTKTEDDPYDFVSTMLSINTVLAQASKRERLIFRARVLDNRDFNDIGNEFGLSYKGAAAAYYRLSTGSTPSWEVGTDEFCGCAADGERRGSYRYGDASGLLPVPDDS